jgi:hypothetical protein
MNTNTNNSFSMKEDVESEEAEDFDRDGTIDLWESCQNGDSNHVLELLQRNSIMKDKYTQLNLNWINDLWGGRPIDVAAAEGHHDIMYHLLQFGANPIDRNATTYQTNRTKRANKLEKYGYTISSKVVKRKKSSAILRDILSSPTIIDVQVNYANTKTIMIKSTHKYHLLLGSCEYQMRQTKIGAYLETPYIGALSSNNIFIGPQEKFITTALLSNMFPCNEYLFRVRYHSNYNGTWCTNWSEWSTSCTLPDDSLKACLIHCNSLAGTSFPFIENLNDFCKIGIKTKDDLLQLSLVSDSQKNSLDKLLISVHTTLDYYHRRTLIRILRSIHEQVDYEDYNYKYLYGKEQIESSASTNYTEMYNFLQSLEDGMEKYTDMMFRLVDNVNQLFRSYRNKNEFINDIKEVVPGIKPTHRRIIWNGIQKETSNNKSTMTTNINTDRRY